MKSDRAPLSLQVRELYASALLIGQTELTVQQCAPTLVSLCVSGVAMGRIHDEAPPSVCSIHALCTALICNMMIRSASGSCSGHFHF